MKILPVHILKMRWLFHVWHSLTDYERMIVKSLKHRFELSVEHVSKLNRIYDRTRREIKRR